MELSWQILTASEIVSLFWLAAMFLAQQLDEGLPPRHSIVKDSDGQKFLYMQDWYTVKYGDIVAVPLIVNAFLHLATNGEIGFWQWIGFTALAITLTTMGFLSCLDPDHRDDQGFRDGLITAQGALHMPYFGVGWSMGIFSLLNLLLGKLTGPVMWLGIFGGVFYFICLVVEFKSGNFDSLKKKELTNALEALPKDGW